MLALSDFTPPSVLPSPPPPPRPPLVLPQVLSEDDVVSETLRDLGDPAEAMDKSHTVLKLALIQHSRDDMGELLHGYQRQLIPSFLPPSLPSLLPPSLSS